MTETTRHITLQTENLSIGYRNGQHTTVVASEMNLELYSGTITCLLGPNGIGKSTLLRTLARQQPAIEGRIKVDGRDIQKASLRDVARMMSVVYTERTNAGALTAREVVSLGRQPHTGFFGRLDATDRRIVGESLETVGIANLASRYMATLSDGERQKVMIARALAQQAPVMILDEPTSFLDVASRLEVMQLLTVLARDYSTSILLSTHDVGDALNIANQLWLMPPKGEIITGSVDVLTASEKMDALFPGRGIVFDREVKDYRIKAD